MTIAIRRARSGQIPYVEPQVPWERNAPWIVATSRNGRKRITPRSRRQAAHPTINARIMKNGQTRRKLISASFGSSLKKKRYSLQANGTAISHDVRRKARLAMPRTSHHQRSGSL